MKISQKPRRRSHRKIDVKLSTATMHAWQSACLEHARLRGVPAELPPQTKLEKLLVQEQNNLLQLWEAFTTQRADLQRYLADPKKQASVYLLGFHLANQARIQGILRRWMQRLGPNAKQLLTSSPQKIFDLGCGTAAMSLGWLETMKRLPEATTTLQNLTLIDSRGAFLDVARSLLTHYNPEITAQTLKLDLQVLQTQRLLTDQDNSGSLQIGLLGYVWNELHRSKKAQQRIDELVHTMADKRSILVFLEPANQQLARQSMELRDQLVGLGYVPQYPCVAATPCPMLQRNRDWCYSELQWQQPGIAKKLDKILKTERQTLSTSGYVFISRSLIEQFGSASAKQDHQPNQVVVGRPVTKQGKGTKQFNYLLCDGHSIESKSTQPTDIFRLRGESYFSSSR